MDDQSSRRLRRKIADHDLVAVDEELERLHDHVADEKRAQNFSGRVPCHPVDHAKTDERRANVAREHLGRDGCGDTEPGQHRLRRHEQCEPEKHRRDAPDHEREPRTHGAEGRVELGIGAGDVPTDSGIFGTAQWSAGERVERLEDQLQLLDALLRGRPVTSTGRHYSVTGAQLPEPVQRPRPPLVVAGEGRKSLRLVARHADAWVTLGGQPLTPERGVPTVSEGEALRTTRERVAMLEADCREIGRDPREIRRIVLAYRRHVDPLSSLEAFDEFVGSYAEMGFDEFVFYWPSILATFREQRAMTVSERSTTERIAAMRFSKAEPGSWAVKTR